MTARRIALTLSLLALGALGGAFVLTRAFACVALPLSAEVEPPPSAPETGPQQAGPVGAGPDAAVAYAEADAGALVAEDDDGTDRRSPRRRPRRGGRDAEREARGSAGPRVVAREEVERVIADPSELRGASVRLHEVDGEPVGLELSGVRAGGPLSRIGLRNGDVLVSVNGIGVHDADGAVDALTRLRAASDFRVRILRGGAPRTLTYRVE